MSYSNKWIVNKPFTITEKDPHAGELCCPVLTVLPCGDFLLTYADKGDYVFSSTGMLRSRDGGLTWNKEKTPLPLFSVLPLNTVVRCYDIYCFAVKDAAPGRFIYRYRDSLDGGKTFGSEQFGFLNFEEVYGEKIGDIPNVYFLPENLFHWQNVLKAAGWQENKWNDVEYLMFYPNPSSCLEMLDGSLLNLFYPCSHNPYSHTCSKRKKEDKPYMCDVAASLSTDKGVTWKFLSYLNPPYSEEFEGYAEGSVVMLDDNNLYVVMRHGGGGRPIVETVSTDFGRSWQEPKRMHNKVRGVLPQLTRLSDGALAMSYGRPGMHLMFSPSGSGTDWEVDQRIDIWDYELLTLKTNAEPVISRTDVKSYKSAFAIPIDDMPWVRPELLFGYFCSWENVCFREVSPGKILFVYDLQNFIEYPGASPKKVIRGVWITKQ